MAVIPSSQGSPSMTSSRSTLIWFLAEISFPWMAMKCVEIFLYLHLRRGTSDHLGHRGKGHVDRTRYVRSYIWFQVWALCSTYLFLKPFFWGRRPQWLPLFYIPVERYLGGQSVCRWWFGLFQQRCNRGHEWLQLLKWVRWQVHKGIVLMER